MAISVNLPGIVNGTSDGSIAQDRALFLTEYGGMVIQFFKEMTHLRDKHMVLGIRGAKSYDFPVIGGATGGYHTPGTELEGRAILHGKRNIGLDRRLTHDVIVDTLEDLLNYYSVQRYYAREQARFLANTFDEHVMLEIIRGAQTAAQAAANAGDSAMDDMLGGKVVSTDDLKSATLTTQIGALKDSLAEVAEYMDTHNVPRQGRYVILPPDLWWNFINYSSTIDNSAFINRDVGGVGSVANGDFGNIFGFIPLQSNLIPTADYSADVGLRQFHKVNASLTKAVAFQSEAVGSLVAMDINSDLFERKELRGWQLVAEYAMGHGVLRPECCAQLKTAT